MTSRRPAASTRTILTALAAMAVATACAGSISSGSDPTTPVADDGLVWPAAPADAWTATVTHITDGDTLWVRVTDPGADPEGDGPEADEEVKLRLLRIDTPELAHNGDPVECLAEEATQHLAGLVPEGAEVRGAYDVEVQDRYGRDLVHLWTSDGLWVNGAMLADGYARVVTFPPNVAYDDLVRALEDEARLAGRGLWSAC